VVNRITPLRDVEAETAPEDDKKARLKDSALYLP
jgi:hypothetical protein